MKTVCREDGTADVTALGAFHRSIRARVIMRMAEIAGLREDVAMAHVRAIDELVCKNSPSGRISLPAGFEAVFEYGALRITDQNRQGQQTPAEGRRLTAVFDADEIKKLTPAAKL